MGIAGAQSSANDPNGTMIQGHAMLPKPLLRQLRRILRQSRRRASGQLAGHYEAAVRGAGLVFADVRPYQPGDDVRHLDWNVTARTGVPHVKQFVEERERIVYLGVDASGSQHFGSNGQTKYAVATQVAALLAFAGAMRRDRVGLVMFTDRVERRLRPLRGERQAQRIVRELFAYTPSTRGTSLTSVLTPMRSARRGTLFLISDFLSTGWERALGIAARKHDLIAVVIHDPAESELPNLGRIRLMDAESKAIAVINTGKRHVREQYAALARLRRSTTLSAIRAAGADALCLATTDDPLAKLVQYFQARERRT